MECFLQVFLLQLAIDQVKGDGWLYHGPLACTLTLEAWAHARQAQDVVSLAKALVKSFTPLSSP